MSMDDFASANVKVESSLISITVENLGFGTNMMVDPSVTVAQLCELHLNQTQMDLPFVTLYGHRLSRHSTLRDSGVVEGSILIGSFHLIFDDRDFGTQSTLVVGPDETLDTVIHRFRDIMRRPIIESTSFTFREMKLDHSQTLSGLQLKHTDTIVVSSRAFDVNLVHNGRRQTLSVNRAISLRQLYERVRALLDIPSFKLETGSVVIPNNEQLLNNTQLRHGAEIVVVSALDQTTQKLRYLCHACGSEVMRSNAESVMCHKCCHPVLYKARQAEPTEYLAR